MGRARSLAGLPLDPSTPGMEGLEGAMGRQPPARTPI